MKMCETYLIYQPEHSTDLTSLPLMDPLLQPLSPMGPTSWSNQSSKFSFPTGYVSLHYRLIISFGAVFETYSSPDVGQNRFPLHAKVDVIPYCCNNDANAVSLLSHEKCHKRFEITNILSCFSFERRGWRLHEGALQIIHTSAESNRFRWQFVHLMKSGVRSFPLM